MSRISRFIAFLVITPVLAFTTTGMIPARPLLAGSAIRAGQIRQASAEDFALGTFDGVALAPAGESGLVLAAGRQQGQFTSPVLKADFPFNAAGIGWDEDRPELSGLEIELRISPDGQTWKDWHQVSDGDSGSELKQHLSDLSFLRGSCVQYRLTLTANDSGQTPVLRDITIRYIDSSAGPDLATARATRAKTLGVDTAGPAIISRAAWGCPEADYSVNWPPQYASTQVAIVHHTDTPMDSDPAAAVRAIWYDHTYGDAYHEAWGDIGYNYLVDQFGDIFEGRYGGDNVVGAHAGSPYNYGSLGVALIGNYVSTPPAGQSLSALEDLLAWKLNWHGIDATGSGQFYDRYVANLMGHRDVSATECPGGSFYDLLPGVRSSTKYRENWWSHNTPGLAAPGQTAWVSLVVENKGAQTWSPGGSTSFDLGYHWYYQNGAQYYQSPQDDHRTAVPWPVAYGQSVTINALLTAPTAPGTYTLKWDMVQENVTWFSDQGNPPLVVTVVVDQFPPNPTFTRTPTPGPPDAPTKTPAPLSTPTPKYSPTPTHSPTPTYTPTPTFTPTPVPPTLKIEATDVAFILAPEATPRPLVVHIQNAGTGTFSWQAAPSSERNWLKVDPIAAGEPGDLVLSVDPSALGTDLTPPAVLDGAILIQALPSTVMGSPQILSARLVVADRLFLSYFPLASKGYGSGW